MHERKRGSVCTFVRVREMKCLMYRVTGFCIIFYGGESMKGVTGGYTVDSIEWREMCARGEGEMGNQ